MCICSCLNNKILLYIRYNEYDLEDYTIKINKALDSVTEIDI